MQESIIALPLVAICLIFQNDMRWLSQSRANLLAIIDVILFIPGLYTGNGNWSAPIINNGGLAAAQFIVFLLSVFACYLSPACLEADNIRLFLPESLFL
jgi:hypothetical protein